MRKSFILPCLCVLFLLFNGKLKAQDLLLAKEESVQFTIGPGFFSSDMGRDGILQFYDPRISVGFNYINRFNDRWSFRAGLSYGYYEELDGNYRPTRKWNVGAHIMDVSAAIQFYILKRESLSAKCPDFYIGGGVGAICSFPHLWVEEGGRPLPDGDKILSKKYAFSPAFPLSIGAIFSVTRKLLLGVDYTFRLTTSDMLDGLAPIGTVFPDLYSSLSLTVNYVFKTDCYMCHSALSKGKFRKTKASSGYWF